MNFQIFFAYYQRSKWVQDKYRELEYDLRMFVEVEREQQASGSVAMWTPIT
jgi:hypothetical protein